MRTFLCLTALSVVALAAESNSPLLLQRPTLSKSQIVFVYAGDLWAVPRDGGDARRLTAGVGVETNPVFSSYRTVNEAKSRRDTRVEFRVTQ